MKKIILALIILTIGGDLLTSISVNSKHAHRGFRRHRCPDVEGSPLALCADTFKNWCAYFSGDDCDSNICQKQTANDCTACLDPNVKYYTKRECTDKKVFCDPFGPPQSCSQRWDPVCGYYTENCPYQICSRTVSNSCEACRNGFDYFIEGRCTNPTEITCKRSLRCGSNSPDVCGFFTEGCPYGYCEQTYANRCVACRDSKVIFQRPNICENETPSCELIDIPEVCPTDSQPVCASLRECDGCERRTRTFDNVCFACKEGGYSLLKDGVCPEDQ